MLPLRRALTCLESRDRPAGAPKTPPRNHHKHVFSPAGLLLSVERNRSHPPADIYRRSLSIINGHYRRTDKRMDTIENDQDLEASISVESIKAALADKEALPAARSPPVQVDLPSTVADAAAGSGATSTTAKITTEITKVTKITVEWVDDIEGGFTFNWIRGPADFQRLVEHCQRAIDRNVHPTRISQGSSGSYFVKDEQERIVGVFKPKDEEPYGQLNPRWIKWLHRTCCPCLFGRSFLTPNTGYISEAAASLVDGFLGLEVVPQTQIAHLSSAAFVFPWWEHYRVWRERMDDPAARYPLKLGSFQLFVSGFEPSATVLERLGDLRPLEPELRRAFQAEFERMTILDYAIRNTDRSMDNWLIHLSWIGPDGNHPPPPHQRSMTSAAPSVAGPEETATATEATKARSDTDLSRLQDAPHLRPRVKIACIDNGLAFPIKHPDEWRSYPYSWASLPEAKVPYSQEIRRQLLPLLAETANWESLIGRLRLIFQIDSDFDDKTFRKQMAVLRGQLHNIVQVLQHGGSPEQLVARPLLLVDEDEEVPSPVSGDPVAKERFEQQHKAPRKHRHTHVTTKPLFSCW